ncbi:uncharacterized protein LOC120000989 isoform X2 [Tripterygium wilfordii]|uniref:uncharacterized protein LOC120000989 isoform X2 n=1 Tax=Tripterygium wilfordii TaxID=458696 RepID=UPI0018F7E8BB|nr:uncharacterized protein LOC120000989 isoform X2 [Tripterygium wilfordii]
MAEIEEIENGAPRPNIILDVDEIHSESLNEVQINLLHKKVELSNLKQKQAGVVNEAESTMASLTSSMNFFAFSNSFLAMVVKSTVSCISLTSALIVAGFLLCTLVYPVCLAFIRMKAVFLDFTELTREQSNLINFLGKPPTVADLMDVSSSPITSSSVSESYMNEVARMIKRVKSMNGSLYGNVYYGCLCSVSVSLMVYVGTMFWIANWETCETSTAPASSPGLDKIKSLLLPLLMEGLA